jgi:Fur family ferric uptake transcriptional regulator
MKTTRNTAARSAIQHKLNGLCDRVTIYRVLDRLLDDGLIHKIVNVNGVVNYAACNSCDHNHQHDHEHIHFSCRICGELTCLDQVIPSFALPGGFQSEESFFTISGICKNCKDSEK